MPAAHQRDVVVELNSRVVVVDGNEEGHPEAVAALEIECGIGERTVLTIDQRAVVGPRAILAGQLETELIVPARRQRRDQRTGNGVGGVLLLRVGAAAPGIDVEGAVLLLGPGVVVAQREQVVAIDMPVDLGEVDAGIIGAGDGSVFVRAAKRGQGVDHALLDARRVGLLGGAAALNVEGREEERLVLHDRTAEGESDLLLVEGELGIGRAVRFLAARRERVVLAKEMSAAGEVVGTGLRQDRDEARSGPSKLGVGAVGHDDHLLDGIEIEGKGGPLAATLLAEEGIVEVGAIDHHVVVNAALAVDRDLVAIGALYDGHTG